MDADLFATADSGRWPDLPSVVCREVARAPLLPLPAGVGSGLRDRERLGQGFWLLPGVYEEGRF